MDTAQTCATFEEKSADFPFCTHIGQKLQQSYSELIRKITKFSNNKKRDEIKI